MEEDISDSKDQLSLDDLNFWEPSSNLLRISPSSPESAFSNDSSRNSKLPHAGPNQADASSQPLLNSPNDHESALLSKGCIKAASNHVADNNATFVIRVFEPSPTSQPS